MPTIGLTTFLKLYSLDVRRKEREYRKYLGKGGGYDFYWTLKRAASESTFGAKSPEEVQRIFKKIKNTAEIKNNKEGLKSLTDWLADKKFGFFEPPQGVVKSPKEFLTIKLKPEFGTEATNGKRLVNLWNTKVPEFTQQAAGIGIYLIESNLCVEDYAECKSVFFDLRKKIPYVTARVPDEVKISLAAELNWVDQFFETAAREAAA